MGPHEPQATVTKALGLVQSQAPGHFTHREQGTRQSPLGRESLGALGDKCVLDSPLLLYTQ